MSNFFDLTRFLIFLQAAPTGPQSTSEMFANLMPMLIFFMVAMYLFIIRPQRKQEKEKKQLLESIKKNDRVVTVGGMHGTVTSVKSETVTLSVADKVQLKFNKGSIQTVLRKGKSDDSDTDEDESEEE